MKKVSIVLFVILFASIVGLYFLHFSKSTKSNSVATVAGVPGQGIAYVNIDSVIFKFEMAVLAFVP